MEAKDLSDTAVVVTDDQEKVLQTVSSTLEKAGFTILAASSGASALKRCRESDVPVNLAIIDTTTFGVDVAELVGQLDVISPKIRTLFLTGDDENELRGVRGTGHGRRSLRKPFRRSQLLGQVLEIMNEPLVLTA